MATTSALAEHQGLATGDDEGRPQRRDQMARSEVAASLAQASAAIERHNGPALSVLRERARVPKPSRVAPRARRLVTNQDMGCATAGLATDAAKLITGDTIYIDGGYHIMRDGVTGWLPTWRSRSGHIMPG